LQKVPQMSDAIADVVKDFKLKLPDRRYLFMYNSPQMENFREMGALDDVAKKQQDHRIMQEEVLEQAREGGPGNNVPDLTHVTAEVTRQANMAGALRQQMENLAATTARHEEGMRREHAMELERLAGAQRVEAEKARIAREVTQVHLDGMAADRDRMREATTAAGVTNNVTHLYDQRVTNTTTMEQNNAHAIMMNFMAHHQGQLATFAQQQGMSHDKAMKVLYEHMQNQQATQQPVIQILNQTLTNPNLPSDYRPPPPNPPAAASSGYGPAPRTRDTVYPYAISAPTSFAPAPVPVAKLVPETPASTVLIPGITKAPPPLPPPDYEPPKATASRTASTAAARSRSRMANPPAGKGRKAKADMEDVKDTPVSTRPSSRAPAKTEQPTPTIDAAMPSALKRVASQEAERVPTIRASAARAKRPASVGEEVPVIRAKARPRTPSVVETPQPPARPRSQARSESKDVVPVGTSMNTGRGRSSSRPPVEVIDLSKPPKRKASRRPPSTAESETPQVTKAPKILAIEDGEVVPQVKMAKRAKSLVKQKPKMIGKTQNIREAVGAQSAAKDKPKIVSKKLDKEALRAQIKRVRIENTPATKKGRGRPPGSLNKATIARQAGRVLVPA